MNDTTTPLPCPHALAPAVLPDDVTVLEAAPIDHVSHLFPEEAVAIERAVEKRRNEFSTGRYLAHQALERLGHVPTPIPYGDDRAPGWPDGIVGAITHTKGHCAVALAPASRYAAIGLDIERIDGMTPAIGRRIATDREIEGITDQGLDFLVACTILFSAKEAYYKLQYPLTRAFLGFDRAEVSVEVDDGTFRVRPMGEPLNDFPAPENGSTYSGRFRGCCGLMATGMVLAAR